MAAPLNTELEEIIEMEETEFLNVSSGIYLTHEFMKYFKIHSFL